MIRRARVFLFILMLNRVAFPQTLEDLAQTAARAMQRKFLRLMEVNFVESNPIPVKAALALMGLLEPVYRLPMCPPKPESLAKIEKVLVSLGLLADRRVRVAG